jgi:hypothetical protein
VEDDQKKIRYTTNFPILCTLIAAVGAHDHEAMATMITMYGKESLNGRVAMEFLQAMERFLSVEHVNRVWRALNAEGDGPLDSAAGVIEGNQAGHAYWRRDRHIDVVSKAPQAWCFVEGHPEKEREELKKIIIETRRNPGFNYGLQDEYVTAEDILALCGQVDRKYRIYSLRNVVFLAAGRPFIPLFEQVYGKGKTEVILFHSDYAGGHFIANDYWAEALRQNLHPFLIFENGLARYVTKKTTQSLNATLSKQLMNRANEEAFRCTFVGPNIIPSLFQPEVRLGEETEPQNLDWMAVDSGEAERNVVLGELMTKESKHQIPASWEEQLSVGMMPAENNLTALLRELLGVKLEKVDLLAMINAKGNEQIPVHYERIMGYNAKVSAKGESTISPDGTITFCQGLKMEDTVRASITKAFHMSSNLPQGTEDYEHPFLRTVTNMAITIALASSLKVRRDRSELSMLGLSHTKCLDFCR